MTTPTMATPTTPTMRPTTSSRSAASTTGADDLDEDEQAWHRVWAEEPARPSPTSISIARVPNAPVRLSFVPSAAELERRRQLAWATLAEVDLAIAAGRDPSNAVAFAALLAPVLPDDLRSSDLQGALQEVAAPLITQLHVARRDSERLRYLLMAQRKLASARRRGAQAELAGGRELVDDALLLHDLLERAAGRDPGEAPVPTIVPDEGRDDAGEELDANGEPRKRRRRRRGGQRRRHGLGAIAMPRIPADFVEDLVDAGSREHYADAALYDYEYTADAAPMSASTASSRAAAACPPTRASSSSAPAAAA